MAPGGFVGVDVFFVISGFLITGIILREIDAGTFSFRRFYRRRILRIYPALVLVIAVTLLAGYVLMLGPNYAKLGEAPAGRQSALHLYFAGQSGYFDYASTTLPLLHTWSLGVEEQFYFAWPLLLVVGVPLVRALRLPRVVLATVISAFSLAFAYFAMQDSPAVAFYSPLSRAWELGLGAIVGIAAAARWPQNRPPRQRRGPRPGGDRVDRGGPISADRRLSGRGAAGLAQRVAGLDRRIPCAPPVAIQRQNLLLAGPLALASAGPDPEIPAFWGERTNLDTAGLSDWSRPALHRQLALC